MSEIRADRIYNEDGSSGPSFPNGIPNLSISGIVTATSVTIGAGSAASPSLSPSGDSNTGIFFPSADTIAFSEGGAEAMRISSNGNIEVNTNGGQLQISDGNAASPGLTFWADGAGDTGIFRPGANTLSLTTAGTEGVRLDDTGRLLVGTTTQGTGDSKLLVSGANPNLRIQSSSFPNGYADLDFTAPANNGLTTPVRAKIRLAHTTGDGGWDSSLRFFVGGFATTERMRITNDGYVGIGCTERLGHGGIFFRNNVSNGGGEISWNRADNSNATYALAFYNNAGFVGAVYYTNTTTVFLTSSDYRLKENVVPLTGAADRLNQLQVHRFNFIADPSKTFDGFLAHEAQAVVPEAISGVKDEVEVWKEGEELPDGVSVGDNKLDEDGNTIPIYQGIDQSKLVPLLTAALQETIAELNALKAENATLKDDFIALAARVSALESN